MSDLENNNLPPEDETSIEAFLEEDAVKKDKVEVIKKEKRTVTIIKPDNNSGMGEPAPYSIAKKYNWGACLFNWIWGLRYKKFGLLLVPLFCIFPYGFIAGLVICIWAGTKGNQWAWEEVEYKDETDFHNAQKSWVKTWLIIAGILLVSTLPFVIINSKKEKVDAEMKIEDYNLFTSLELKIPDKIYEETTTDDNHSDILTSNKHIIYWVRPKNELAERNKEYIEEMYNIKKEQLKDKFVLYPDLKGMSENNTDLVDMTLKGNCINSTCVDDWLYSNCNRGYCIINPKTRTYYKIRERSMVIPKAVSLIKKWD